MMCSVIYLGVAQELSDSCWETSVAPGAVKDVRPACKSAPEARQSDNDVVRCHQVEHLRAKAAGVKGKCNAGLTGQSPKHEKKNECLERLLHCLWAAVGGVEVALLMLVGCGAAPFMEATKSIDMRYFLGTRVEQDVARPCVQLDDLEIHFLEINERAVHQHHKKVLELPKLLIGLPLYCHDELRVGAERLLCATAKATYEVLSCISKTILFTQRFHAIEADKFGTTGPGQYNLTNQTPRVGRWCCIHV